jgi:hypothetical protein
MQKFGARLAALRFFQISFFAPASHHLGTAASADLPPRRRHQAAAPDRKPQAGAASIESSRDQIDFALRHLLDEEVAEALERVQKSRKNHRNFTRAENFTSESNILFDPITTFGYCRSQFKSCCPTL